MSRRILLPTCLLGLTLGLPVHAASVVDSVHNLSASGAGSIRASDESGVCMFCHTPHDASPDTPLWNRRLPGTTYTPYASSTAVAAPGQPTGASLLCLGCHDGTVALGDVLGRDEPIAMTGGTDRMPAGRALTGTDLRHHHPVSFVYDAVLAGRQGELALPSALPPEIALDAAGQLQCTSCHDPHDDRFGAFLVMPNRNSRLCTTCHRPAGWHASAHARSDAAWTGAGPSPWPHSGETTVSGNGCRNCHEAHQAAGGPLLLRAAPEAAVCAACHDGRMAARDVMRDFEQFSAHPVPQTSLTHDPAEPAVVRDRHVSCSDCHGPHDHGAGPADAPGQLRGVDLNNAAVEPAAHRWQVCLRCHGDSPGKRTPLVRRQFDQDNLRLEIQPANPSFHPVAAPGRNPDVPSLLPPWTPQSLVDCTDCHHSGDSARPHGSVHEPLLARRYETRDRTPESPSAYALCYGCHSRDSILRDASFAAHARHVRDASAPCSVCHDAHGISATQGNPLNNSHLVNFDTTVVTANTAGRLRFVDEGRFRGRCDLSCHGVEHRGEGY